MKYTCIVQHLFDKKIIYIYFKRKKGRNNIFPTKHPSTKQLLHTKEHSMNADTGTLYSTNHPQLTNEKTDNGTTYSGTTPHSAKTSALTSDVDSLP